MTDTSDLRGRLNQYAQITGREISESVRQFARVACVNLATETQPWGNKKYHKLKGEIAVRNDINKVYYKATGKKFLEQATNLARGYYKANQISKATEKADKFRERLKKYQRSNNTGYIAGIAADLGFEKALIETFDETRHKLARNSHGRIRNTEPTLLIGADAQLDKYIEKTQKKVGLTKAGWAVCAEAIPLKRVSSATRDIPQWVTRNKGRASGRIDNQSQDPVNPRVRMTNATPWTSQVLTPQQADKALRIARDNFVKYMNTAIKKTLREQVKLKSA